MIFVYYPLILISILGYGFFVSKKIINPNIHNLGYQGIVGIFSLLLISYVSTQFLAHTEIFNLLVLITGLILFFRNIKKFDLDRKNFQLLFFYIYFISYFYISWENS